MTHIHAGGHDLICSRKHLILAKRGLTGTPRWVRAQTLTADDFVAVPGIAPVLLPQFPRMPQDQGSFSPLISKFHRYRALDPGATPNADEDNGTISSHKVIARIAATDAVDIRTASSNLQRFLRHAIAVEPPDAERGAPDAPRSEVALSMLRRGYLLRLFEEGVFPTTPSPRLHTLFRLCGAFMGRLDVRLDKDALLAWVRTFYTDVSGMEEVDAARSETFSDEASCDPARAHSGSPSPRSFVPSPLASGGGAARVSVASPLAQKNIHHPQLRGVPPALQAVPLPRGDFFIDDPEVGNEIIRDIIGLGLGPPKKRVLETEHGTLLVLALPRVLVLAVLALGMFCHDYVEWRTAGALSFAARGAMGAAAVLVRTPALAPCGVVNIPAFSLSRLSIELLSSIAGGLISSHGIRALDPRESLQHGMLLAPVILAGGRRMPPIVPGADPTGVSSKAATSKTGGGNRLKSRLNCLFSRIGLPVSFSKNRSHNFIASADARWKAAASPRRAGAGGAALVLPTPTDADLIQMHFPNTLSVYWLTTRVGFPYCPSLRRAAPWLITQTRYPLFLLGNIGPVIGTEMYSSLREKMRARPLDALSNADTPTAHQANPSSFSSILQDPVRKADLGASKALATVSPYTTVSPPSPALLELLYSRVVNGVPFPYETELRRRRKPKWAHNALAQIVEQLGAGVGPLDAGKYANGIPSSTTRLLSLNLVPPVAPFTAFPPAASHVPLPAPDGRLDVDEATFSLLSARPCALLSLPPAMYARGSPLLSWLRVDWTVDVGKRAVCSLRLRATPGGDSGVITGGIVSKSAPLR